jgi:hypothetical protein
MTFRLWHQGVFFRSRIAFLRQTSGQAEKKAAARDWGRREAEAKSRADHLPKKQQNINQAGRKEGKAPYAHPDIALAVAKLADEDALSDDVAVPPSALVLASAQCRRQAVVAFPRAL